MSKYAKTVLALAFESVDKIFWCDHSNERAYKSQVEDVEFI